MGRVGRVGELVLGRIDCNSIEAYYSNIKHSTQ